MKIDLPICSMRGAGERQGMFTCGCPKVVGLPNANYVTPRTCVGCPFADNVSSGLGDTVAKITRRIGIKPCGGCKDRQKKLNELVPYKKP